MEVVKGTDDDDGGGDRDGDAGSGISGRHQH